MQKLRHKMVPQTPSSIADVSSTKIVFERSELPIQDSLIELFPTLLKDGAAGMPQLELKVDNQNGTILKSEKPLKVSSQIDYYIIAGWLRTLWWPGCWRSQCRNGTFRYDQESAPRFHAYWLPQWSQGYLQQ